MTFRSSILAGSKRLDLAASSGPSVKRRPPADEPDAVKRIQKGLIALGFQMPRSLPAGPNGEPDGIFGEETYRAVVKFQRREFPKDASQWDGRVGRLTLGRIDDLLCGSGEDTVMVQGEMLATSQCRMQVPGKLA